jgi:ABC-type transporter Mla MlaB component
LAGVRDATVAHRRDERLARVDGDGLELLLEVQRVAAGAGAEVE